MFNLKVLVAAIGVCCVGAAVGWFQTINNLTAANERVTGLTSEVSALTDELAQVSGERNEAVEALAEFEERLAGVEENFDAAQEQGFYDGLTTGCLVMWGGTFQQPPAKFLPWCETWLSGAKEADAYHNNKPLSMFMEYLNSPGGHPEPPKPKNQSRPIIPGSLVNVRFEHGTRILGH